MSSQETLPKSEILKLEGNSFFSKKDYHQAYVSYSAAIKAFLPESGFEKLAIYYSNRALSSNELQNYQQALQDLDHSIELNPNNPKPHYLKALTFYKLEDYESSKNTLDQLSEKINVKLPEVFELYVALDRKFQEMDKKSQEKNEEFKTQYTKNPDKNPFNSTAKEKFNVDMDNASWSKGLLHNAKYEWLFDCYRMRIDDDYAIGGGNLRGLYDPDHTPASILLDFCFFCRLAKCRNVLPNQWQWKDFLKVADNWILSAFEKEDAKDKYGSENVFDACFGGRSLRFTGEIVYGYSAMNYDAEYDEIYKKIDEELEKVKLKKNEDFVKFQEVFKEVGGFEVWKELFNSIKNRC